MGYSRSTHFRRSRSSPTHGIGWWLRIWLGPALFLAAHCSPCAAAEGPAGSEYEVKAVFLLRFAQFVTWPTQAFGGPKAPISVGILGDDPFGAMLDKLIEDETVGARRIVAKRSRRADDLKTCHIVFISKSEAARIGEVIGAFQGTSVLTVGESDQFVRQGGMIGFRMGGATMRFDISASAARHAGLEISSRLLKLAQ